MLRAHGKAHRVGITQGLCFGISLLALVLLAQVADAEKKKIDNDTLDIVNLLNKDRESAFVSGEGMPISAYQDRWTGLVARLDSLYVGHEVRLNKFGSHVRFRQAFTELIYLNLRVHTKVGPLSPAPQEVVARHPFLQELVMEGSCYTDGGRYEKKMSDLLAAYPEFRFVLREHLEKWDSESRKEFEKAYPMKAAKTME
ncbi:MAG: hypothetical protein O2954_01920 [bacterium]|nr:hypothetical protein [bacterium]